MKKVTPAFIIIIGLTLFFCLLTGSSVLAGMQVAAGGYHTVGLKTDGTVVAVGETYYGQCNVGNWTRITQVAAGANHTIGLKAGGTVMAVGDNGSDQCDIGSWTGIVQVAAGGDHTVGLKTDGTMVAVGENGHGECDIGSWTGIVQVAAGCLHTVGLKADGTVVAVGDNGLGQGNVGSWTGITQVAAGCFDTIGLKADGTVMAVGFDGHGECDVGDWTGITQVAAGWQHTVGLKADGTVVAVGDNGLGQGNVGSWTGITQVAAGFYHTIGLKADGTVVAVGYNNYGQCNLFDWNLARINLPKTGQMKCYDTNGIEIPCAGTGQDGEIQAGVAWPDPRFTPNADTTVTDNLTGLIWAPDGNIMPTRDPGWDTDYTANDGMVTWQHALDYVAKLNTENYLGYTDWRLPNVNELESLINANEPNPANWLVSLGFSNVQTSYYWSSTTAIAYITDYAWMVNILRSLVIGGSKSGNYDVYVWPVRGGQCGSFVDSVICLPQTGQTVSYAAGDDGDLERGVAWPSPRFTDHGNGTVTDNLTGLMWTKDANLPGGYITWQQALDYVTAMNAGTYTNYGYTDWRLPNRKELHSLTDYSQYSPALPIGHPFTNVQAENYWTSTTEAFLPYSAEVVHIWGGVVSSEIKSCSYCYYYLWPVRGGAVGPQTLITLSSFTATPSDRKVILEWVTASEIDNAGFNLYRAESEDGEYIKINSLLINAEGSPTSGATYKYVDNNVKNRTTYYYKLEDIDLNGTSTVHGPVSAVPHRVRSAE